MPSQEVRPLPPTAYLILFQDYLVGQDLAEIVADFDPMATVLLRHTLPGAAAALAAVDRIAVAFLGVGPRQLTDLALADTIRRKGGRLVLIGEDAEAQAETGDWTVLRRPFAQAQVQAILAGSATG